jgi:hypothetical protein
MSLLLARISRQVEVVHADDFAGGMATAPVQRDPFQRIRQDDDEVVLIIVAMLGELPCC